MEDVRATIARMVLGRDAGTALGEVTLYDHQREAVARVRQMLERHGGALLADDVGLGKTFSALALADGQESSVVIGPAALRDAWVTAALRAHVAIRFLSFESLGRSGSADLQPTFVIVDEAHHLRSPGTRRFAAASTLCQRARVLLLTATPVHNRLADLRQILSLFLGERAFGLQAEELAQFVVRRVEIDADLARGFALPAVRAPQWIHTASDVDCLERIVALTPPVPPSDGRDGGALLTYSIVRQWASSRAALRATLIRQMARSRAMEDTLRAGRLPSRDELSAWRYADGAQQLSFPELLPESNPSNVAELLGQVRRHAADVRDLLAHLTNVADPDDARVSALTGVLDSHNGERVIAFAEFAETVRAFYHRMRHTARVAMLTHGGGRVAGGLLTRREVLSRFGSGASARETPSDRIDVLITTDVLSEGVNLQDASVVVHLDLPWNPARLAQRVGRLRRPGAARGTISVYAFAPPAPAERLLQLEHRLRQKVGVAARSVGVAGAILPGFLPVSEDEATAAREERIDATLRRWARDGTPTDATPAMTSARSSHDGAIACLRVGNEPLLIAKNSAGWTTDRAVLAQLLDVASDCTAGAHGADEHAVVTEISQWLVRRDTSSIVDLTALHVAHSRRSLLRRVDTIARRSLRHRQPQLAPLMHAARRAATATLSAGAERVLEELAHAPLNDEAWLHAIGQFSALHARKSSEETPELLALLILRRPDELSASRSRSSFSD